MDNTSNPPSPSRRAVVKTVAWSVPVVALTAAAPLASASTGVPDIGVEVQTGCGVLPGLQSYPEIRFVATGPDPIPAGTQFEIFTGGTTQFAVGILPPSGNLVVVGGGTGSGVYTLPVDVEVGGWAFVSYQPDGVFTCDLRARLSVPTATDPDFFYEETVCSGTCGPA